MIPFRKRRPKFKKCPVCTAEAVVEYKDVPLLKKYISERGKIFGRAKTGVCAKHQRQLTRSIKRARYVALLPFAQR